MRFISALLLLGAITVGCAVPQPTATPVALTRAAQALAQATLAPTRFSTSASIATATRLPPTRTLAPSAVPTQAAPRILTRFQVNELPGEGRGPAALAILGDKTYVANRGSSNIGVISNDRVSAFIPLEGGPSALAADPGRNRIFAGTYVSPTLAAIENDEVVRRVNTLGRVNALAVDGDLVYVALDNDAIIERYDAATLEKRDELKLSQGFGISDLVIDKPRNRLYAAEYGTIVAIDLSTFQELNTFAAPYLYSDIAVNPADGSVWSGAYDSETSRAYLVGYATDGQEIARVYLGSDLAATAFDDAGRLYVLDRFANQVHIVQTPQAELLATVPVNEAPSDAIFDATRRVVLVTSQDNDNVSVIDPIDQRVTATIALANNLTALASNPNRVRVYAANASTNSVYVIEGAKVVGEIKTGVAPVDLAVDPAASRLYVASRADGLVTLIDEESLQVVSSQFVTRTLSTVALDAVNKKLFAGPYTLDPESLLPEELIFAQGLTLDSQTTPQYELPNPALRKLYGLASNGVPGSNSRLTLFRWLYDDLTQSKLLGSGGGGNTTALALDLTTNNLFATNYHPLGYISELDVFDANDNILNSIGLSSNAPALVVNPATKHLFVAFAQTYQPIPSRPRPQDNTIQILDTETLGHVGALDVPGEPIQMALLGQDIFVASARDGSITVIRDAPTSQPAPPTPTLTATPYPSWTFTPGPPPTTTPIPTATAAALAQNCAYDVVPALAVKARELGRERTGCPVGEGESSDKYAFQPFAAGFMVADFRDEGNKRIAVLFPNKTWRVFPDTWQEGEPELPCEQVPVDANQWRPKRGFGVVWCSEPEVQALGGALFEERGVAISGQQFERGTLWQIRNVGEYFLAGDGTWE